jgi:hypothetical protein
VVSGRIWLGAIDRRPQGIVLGQHRSRNLSLLDFLAVMASPVNAGTGGCYLEVDKKVYLQGQCNIEPAGPHGGFSIGAAVTRTGYFAYVLIDETGIARGYWNGAGAESHAVDDLGRLNRKGACWENESVKVCTSR